MVYWVVLHRGTTLKLRLFIFFLTKKNINKTKTLKKKKLIHEY
jgi:hypothetical protein